MGEKNVKNEDGINIFSPWPANRLLISWGGKRRDRHAYLTDTESGTIQFINRPTKGIAGFLQNWINRYLSRLLIFFPEKKTPLAEPQHHAIDQGIKIAEMCCSTCKQYAIRCYNLCRSHPWSLMALYLMSVWNPSNSWRNLSELHESQHTGLVIISGSTK